MNTLFKKSVLVGLFIFLAFIGIAQTAKFTIKGNIKDASTSEALIGASVMAKPGVGAITDIDGNYSFKIEPGSYLLKINYVGYLAQVIKVKLVDKDINVNILLESQTLDEVEITANIGTVRETPVAISNISAQKIQEELAGRDLPMILNSTPGVYATQQGGGAGDSRVTLRGFDQTNIAVMVDGVPVNDMENGAVYWSNWDGLSEITKTMQVQRGLGATKLAVAAAGGLINIITNSIDQKRQITVKQDFGNNNYHRTSFSYNSGLVNNKFGLVLAGSRRKGDGYVEGTYLDAWSYFVKLQWKVNSRHLLSISANGAPQRHGQRNSKSTIGLFSQEYAAKVGVEDPEANMLASGIVNTSLGERPRHFNYELAKLKGNDFYISNNYYHKPLFNLSHFWSVNEKLTVSTVGYASYGFGGGTNLITTPPNNKDIGYKDITPYYVANETYVPSNLEKKYYGDYRRSSNILRSSVNNHKWYGLLSTAIYKLSQSLTFTFGVDARYYRGLHYREVNNLLGGDYYRDNTSDLNSPKGQGIVDPFNPTYASPNYQYEMKRVGDKIGYNYDGLVNWGGLFSQLEYKKNAWTAFMTLTGSYTGYQRKDYFARKDVNIGEEKKGYDKFINYFKSNTDDKVFNEIIGFNQTLVVNDNSVQTNNASYIVYTNHNHRTYHNGDTTFIVKYNSSAAPIDTMYMVNAESYTIDSKQAKYARTRKKWFPGYTIKGGVNYKLNSNYNVYVNFGVLSIAPKFNNVYNGNQVGNREFSNVNNQQIISQEVGMGMKYKTIAANLNIYYTKWNNKPGPLVTIDEEITYNINGINVSHFGVEVDWVYKIIKSVEWEGAVSIAEWKYLDSKPIDLIHPISGELDGTLEFDAKNVHLGNAAQLQLSNAIRWTIYKGFFIKPRYTYFGKHYANFDPISLQGENARRESWKMPNYGLLDLALGYEFKFDKFKINLNGNVTNVLNTFYISDAQNNAINNPATGTRTFDANSATVFIGMGRQFNFGMKLTF